MEQLSQPTGTVGQERGARALGALNVSAMLTVQWHMLGWSIDCCWIQKHQMQVMPGGEMFVIFSRLKISSLQGIRLYPYATH